MDLKRCPDGAKVRSTHKPRGPGRARAAPGSPEGAWAAQMIRRPYSRRAEHSNPGRPSRPPSRCQGIGIVSSATLSVRLLTPQAPRSPPSGRRGGRQSTRFSQPWGSSCGPARGSAFRRPLHSHWGGGPHDRCSRVGVPPDSPPKPGSFGFCFSYNTGWGIFFLQKKKILPPIFDLQTRSFSRTTGTALPS